MHILRILCCWALMASSAFAATFYIDKTLGDDSRTSTLAQSKTTPWAHLRCMASATGNGTNNGASQYTPVAGDIFVLKGGETWTNADFPCKWIWSGTAGNRITVTVDATWKTGGSWSRPIWDAGGTQITTRNVFVWFNNQAISYVTFSNIEMTGLFWTGSPAFGTCGYVVDGNGVQFITLDQVYLHGWTHDTYANGAKDYCNILMGKTTTPYTNGSVIQNSIIDGSDGTGGGDSGRLYYWPSYVNNVIHDMANMIVGGGASSGGSLTISGNSIYNCHSSFDQTPGAPVHGNLLETLGATFATTVYIHDNQFFGGEAGCESALLAGQNATDYLWNNIWYNNLGNAPQFDNPVGVSPNIYFWNNTVVAVTGQYCARHGVRTPGSVNAVIKIQNNHCISSLVGFDPAMAATSLTVGNNVSQLPATATGQGYTAVQSPYVYYPTGGGSTIGAGANLTTNCSIIASLCLDTPYGATIGANHTVVVGARTSFARSGTASWDAGAYQFSDATPKPLAITATLVQGLGSLTVLTWGASTDASFAGYKVYRSTVPNDTNAVVVDTITPAIAATRHSPITRYIERINLQAGTYYYSVTTFNTDLTESVKSSEVSRSITGMSARGVR